MNNNVTMKIASLKKEIENIGDESKITIKQFKVLINIILIMYNKLKINRDELQKHTQDYKNLYRLMENKLNRIEAIAKQINNILFILLSLIGLLVAVGSFLLCYYAFFLY